MVSFVDTFPPTYTEAREAADLAKRLARVQEQQRVQMAAAASAKLSMEQHAEGAAKGTTQQPHSLGQALLQRPALSRTGSNSVLGSIFQSLASTRSSSPFSAKESMITHADIEAAMVAEKKRDADICAMPAWYH